MLLAHDADGKVGQGDRQHIVNAVRQGCRIRIAWGSKGATRTIEHIAEPMWIAIRDSSDIEAQIGDFMINLNALGDPPSDHPRRERFGGVDKVVKWRASLKPDGTFNAVWYYPHDGEFISRVPQRHPMKWFADCKPEAAEALFQLSQGS
ncbi:MAG: hypothetical protein ABJO01_11210 [Parasphingorhabdus sp.]|uniref:hypothetical protein n=1 Tax=Parasphingorhabdus sp. TaxID=2709688 RepID=UPI00329A648F